MLKDPSGRIALAQLDAVEFLRTLESESVNLVLTDPPYESLEKHRKKGTTTRLKNSKASSNDWFEIFPNARFSELFTEVYRVLKPNTHFYMFCDQETMFHAKPLGEAAGFTFWKPIIWDKMVMGMGYHYRAQYECILFFEKGKRKVNHLNIPDVLSFKRVWGGYPTEKPLGVVSTLISMSTQKGEIICDPFCGSGTTGIAAIKAGCDFIGNDKGEEAIQVSHRRIRAALQEQHLREEDHG